MFHCLSVQHVSRRDKLYTKNKIKIKKINKSACCLTLSRFMSFGTTLVEGGNRCEMVRWLQAVYQEQFRFVTK